MPATDPLAEGLFFIVGTGRSGTTLLQAMLASHSRLDIPPETKFFQRHDPIEPRFGGDPLPADRFEAWLEDYFASPDWADLGLERREVEALMCAAPRRELGWDSTTSRASARERAISALSTLGLS